VNKLQTHFKAMQRMATRYLMPEPYADRDGQTSFVAAGSDKAVRDSMFANDMIYMLDGPEQREAEAEVDQEKDDLRTLVRDLMARLHVVDHVVTIDMGDYKKTIVASKVMAD
jgi:hypothetical protein